MKYQKIYCGGFLTYKVISLLLFLLLTVTVFAFLNPSKVSADYPCGAPDQIQVGSSQGSCTRPSDGKTCTAYAHWTYTDGNGQAWCDNNNCADPCSGGGNGDGNYCTAAGYVECNVGAAASGSCTLSGKSCTRYWKYACNYGGKNYCFASDFNCGDPCGSGITPTQGSATPTPVGTCNITADPNLSGGCQSCINTQKGGNLPQQMKDLGSRTGNSGWSSCSDGALISEWCSKVGASECNSIKSGSACASSCGGSAATPPPSGTCPADSNLSVYPTTANVGDPITFQYSSNNGEDQFVGGDTWSAGIDSSSCNWDLTNRRYTCTAVSPVVNGVWSHHWGNPKNCGSATYTINGSATQPTPTTPANAEPTPTTVPQVTTTRFRISETPFDKNDVVLGWREYTAYPMIVPFEFSNAIPSKSLTVYTQFESSDGTKSEVIPKTIKYIGPGPKLTSVSCTFDPTGVGSLVTINGTNFGEQGDNGEVAIGGQTIKPDPANWVAILPDVIPTIAPTINMTPVENPTDNPTQIPTTVPTAVPTTAPTPTPQGVPTSFQGDQPWETQQWDRNPPNFTPTPTSTISNSFSSMVLGAKAFNSLVKVRVPDRLKGSVLVELKADDGRVASRYCTVGITTVDFSAKYQCRPSGDFSVDKVRIQIYESVKGARPVFDQVVKLDQSGHPTWTPPELEVNKKYTMVLKTSGGVAVGKQFTALAGTTTLDDFNLPVGDIYPMGNSDNKINAQDFSELKREWTATEDVVRAGDFNGDGRVNSMDYSCMRQNFNISGVDFLKYQ